MADPVAEFIDAMHAAGIRAIEPISNKLATGQPVRFRAEGDKPGRRNAWAVLHLDGIPAGVFRHYRLGVRSVWRSGEAAGRLSRAEFREHMARAREAEAQRLVETATRQQSAAQDARELWARSEVASAAHGYLVRKHLAPFGIRQAGDTLLVPMMDERFHLWNLQRIFPDSRKLFLKGGRTSGLFWPHGIHTIDGKPSGGPLVIGEGFATMAAIHTATGYAVVAAMSARNIETVAKAMRKLFPRRAIIIAADDDSHLADNIGLIAAQEAAESINAHLATPRPSRPECAPAAPGIDFGDIPYAEIAAIFEGVMQKGTANG